MENVIREKIFSLADEKYKEFHSGLCPNTGNIIGLRVPILRNYAKEHKVNLWEVSERLGYAHETAFSRVLRHELPEDKKTEIKAIIDNLAAE